MKFEQAAIAVQDEPGYVQLHALIDLAFSPREIEVFLGRVTRSKRRIRDFESVLQCGLLGKEAEALYKALPVSDQALTRERYLQVVEAVPEDLRQQYYRAYTSY
jgi:hypothetical protein